MSKPFQKVPLRPILIVPFVVQIFAAVGLIGWLSWQNSQKAVNDIADRLLEEIGDRITHNASMFLDKPQDVHDLVAASIQSGNVKIEGEDISSLQPYFWRQVQTNLVPDLLFANPAGEIVGVQTRSDRTMALRIKDSSTGAYRQKYILDDRGKRTELIQNKVYDPVARPWYQAALKAGKPTWSQVYPSTNLLFPEISAVRPIYDRSGNLLGVLGSELTLEHISNLLRGLHISESGQAFIMERNGALIASSTAEAPFLLDEEQEIRLLTKKSKNPLTQATARYLLDRFVSLEQITQSHRLEFKLNGERQMVWIDPLQDGRSIDWLVVVVVPESDFMARINANSRTTIWLCLGALGLAIAIGIYTSRWVTQPVLRLSQASKAIAAGKLNQRVEESNVTEINRLSSSFNRMAKQLQDSFQALETVNQELEVRVEQRTADLKDKNEALAEALDRLKATQTQMIAQEKLASLGSLTAGIAHEIKNPLNFVNNFSELSVELTDELTEEIEDRKEELDPEFVEDMTEIVDLLKTNVSKIEHHGKRADKIVSNMLMHSRSGESEWVKVDLNELVCEAIDLAYHGMRAKQSDFNIALDADYDESIAPIEVSPQDLNRVFLNIASNACYAVYQRQQTEGRDFTPVLKVRTGNLGDRIEIRISDNGIGMTPEVRDRVFEQFFTTKPTGEGTGLGLSLSYNIVVEQHQGTIEVESKSGVYTEFAVTLPKSIRQVQRLS